MSTNPFDPNRFFDASRYGGLLKKAGKPIEEVSKDAANLFYADGSDALANDGLTIDFEHVPSGETVYFKAFINAFNETYNSDWSEESVYGRTDPIRMFKQTTRSITLAFLVPAATLGEGYENLSKVQKLVQFLYPSYTAVDNALTIAQSPLIRLKLMNLVSNNSNSDNAGFSYDSYVHGHSSASGGLLGVITNVNINQNLDNPDFGVFHTQHSTVIPKMIEISLDFKVIHEAALGWQKGGFGQQEFSHARFPYNTDAGSGAGPRTRERLLADQNQEAVAYTQGINRQRQELSDERSLQAAQDIMKSQLLKANGELNGKGRRLARRLDETTRSASDRRWYVRGITDPEKAGYYATAFASLATDGAGVRQAGINAEDSANALKEERWSWIK